MKKNDLFFSIITPCFNSEKTIRRTIESVLNQTYTNFEYILIDGGSTDSTVSIIKEYQEKYKGRIKYISEKDNGIYDAMNKGIRLASGTLIGIINSDDYYENDALAHMADAYNGSDYLILYGLIRSVFNGQEKMVYLKNHNFLNESMITHPSCFVTKKLYDDFGLYSLEYPYAADYEFMLRMKKNDKVVFKTVYEIISNFSLGGASSNGRAYYDTLKLKRNYKIISSTKYYLAIIKFKIWALLKHFGIL